MFGLMLLGILGLWLLATHFIARQIGKRLPDKPWRPVVRIALFPLVFAVPVLDEIIAWPQMRALCEGTDGYHYAPGITQAKAAGRTVYKRTSNQIEILFSRVRVNVYRGEVVDVTSNEIILTSRAIKPIESLLAIPDSGGGRHTWLLSECPPERDQSRFERNNRLTDEILKLQFVDSPKSAR